jgi:hypothetical protein
LTPESQNNAGTENSVAKLLTTEETRILPRKIYRQSQSGKVDRPHDFAERVGAGGEGDQVMQK